MKKLLACLFVFWFIWITSSNFIITEVFVDWTQEYIEIQYSWLIQYSWTIQIEWIKSSLVEIDLTQALDPGQIIVVWDAWLPIEQTVCQLFDDQTLSLTDSKEVEIVLTWSSWSSTTHIDKESILAIDNQKRSLVLENSGYVPISDVQSINSTEGYFWSPCFLESDSDDQDDWSSTVSTWSITVENQPLLWTWVTIFTWSDTSTWWVYSWTGWVIWSWNQDNYASWGDQYQEPNSSWWPLPPDTVSSIDDNPVVTNQCTNTQNIPNWSLSIYAISPKNWTLADEFLMIKSTTYFSWSINLVWWWRGSNSNTYSLQIYPWIPIVIGNSDRWLSTEYSIIVDSSLSLTDNGETLEILDAHWVTHDQIYWNWSQQDAILFGDELYTWQPRFFTKEWTITELFSLFEWVWCSFSYDWSFIHIVDETICTLPGDSFRDYNEGTNSSTSCLWWSEISSFSWWVVSFTKKIGETVLCSNTMTIHTTQKQLGTWIIDTDTTNEILSWWTIIITEVSPRKWIFPEYIELQVDEGIQGELEIVWAWQWSTSKFIYVTWQQVYVITDTLLPSLWKSNQILINSLSLTDGWELLEVRQWWQLIDTVMYSWSINEDASRNRTISGDLIETYQTPWFTIGLVEHLLPTVWQEMFSCSVRTQNKTPLTSDKKLNLVASVDWKDVTNASSQYSCVRDFNELSYWSEYYEESRCNPWYLSFPEPGMYEIHLTMMDAGWKTCRTVASINAPWLPESSQSNSSWRSWYYQWLYQKRKARFELLKSNISPYWLTTNASWSIVTAKNLPTTNTEESMVLIPWVIEIVKVLPNPLWADKDNEKIILRNKSDEWFSTKDRRIDNWKSSKKLPEVFLPSQEETLIVWTLWLVNSNRCITVIWNDDKQYDRFCYWVAKDDQRFETSNTSLEKFTIEQWNWTELKDFSLSIESTESCIQYKWSSLLCKPLPVDKDTLKQLKSDAKKTLSIQKRYDTELARRKKYQEQLREQKSKTTTVRKDHQNRLKSEKSKSSKYYNEIKDQKRLGTIYRWLIGMRKELLHDEYKPLYVWSDFEVAWNAYRNSLDLFYSNKPLHYWPIVIPATEIETIAAYLWWTPTIYASNQKPSQLIDELMHSIMSS